MSTLRHYVIKDPIGLHARPLTVLVNAVSKFNAPIYLVYKDKKAPLNSLMMAMSLGVGHNESFAIEVVSEDDAAIFEKLEATMREQHLI